MKWLILSLAVLAGCVVPDEGGDRVSPVPADSVVELAEHAGRGRNLLLAAEIEAIPYGDLGSVVDALVQAQRNTDAKALAELVRSIGERMKNTADTEKPFRWDAIKKDIAEGLRRSTQ